MCGIAGYIGPAPVPQPRVSEALARLQHRGPDHAGHKSWTLPGGRHLCLLHTRLSIIDLDPRAHQPMVIETPGGMHATAFNGELYNYPEIRSRLEHRGISFATPSDTEVLLRALAAEGRAALDGFEGMWAFAHFDQHANTLMLSRDRFGEKPLYLWRDGQGGLYFASEVKALTALAGRVFAPDLDHLKRYLVNGYKSLHKTEQTFHAEIRQLAPGHWLEIDGDGAETTGRYWRAAFTPDENLTFDQAVEGARAHLIRSVDIRMRADVPLAFCMSSGVDSNALISIARRTLGRDVHGFTVVNADPRYDEADLTRVAAKDLGVKLSEIAVETTDFLPRLRQLVCAHDAPVYTISYYVHWLLMRGMADAGYKISISGTAADEIFSGYFDHHLLYLAAVNDDPAVHGPALTAWRQHIKPVVRNPFLQDPDSFIRNPGQRDHIYLNADEFSACLTDGWSEEFYEENYANDLMRGRMLNELFHETVPQILHEDDLNAMSVSIENRSPFLDRGLLDFMMTVPTRHLVKNGYAKAILREAVRGIAPDAVVDNRRKVGFNAPIMDLLDINDKDTRAWLLDDGPVFDIVKRDAIEPLLAKDALPNSESKFLFYFVNAKMFLETTI